MLLTTALAEINSIFIMAMLLVVLCAAIFDAKTFTIPNYFSLLVLGLFAAGWIVTGLPLKALPWHVLSFILALVLGLGLFVTGLMGGGDVKIYASISAWSSPMGLLPLTLYITLSGLILSLVFMAIKVVTLRKAGQTRRESFQTARRAKIPYGPAIAMGTIIYVGFGFLGL